MSATFESVIDHITATLRQPPASTLAKFPAARAGFLRHSDERRGSRIELEQMVGQDRVFEVDIESRRVEPVQLGGVAPSGYTVSLPVIVRYEGRGPMDRQRTMLKIASDQEFIVDALSVSTWSSIAKLVTFFAEVGDVRRFELIDDQNGKEYEGFLSEVVITASYDL
jgi:hypothetical protein